MFALTWTAPVFVDPLASLRKQDVIVGNEAHPEKSKNVSKVTEFIALL